MIVVRIKIKEHLAEYVMSKYFDVDNSCVSFPNELDIYHTIYDLLEKRPKDCPVDEGNLPLGIPHRKVGKDPLYYNYLGQRSWAVIQKRINTMFFAELHEKIDENKHRLGIFYLDTVHEFMCKYSIESITSDALLKDFYRWRNTVRQTMKRRRYLK